MVWLYGRAAIVAEAAELAASGPSTYIYFKSVFAVFLKAARPPAAVFFWTAYSESTTLDTLAASLT